MKYAAIFALFALAFIVIANAHEDACGAKNSVIAKCAGAAKFGKCVSCVVRECHGKALQSDTKCEDIQACVSASKCAENGQQ